MPGSTKSILLYAGTSLKISIYSPMNRIFLTRSTQGGAQCGAEGSGRYRRPSRTPDGLHPKRTPDRIYVRRPPPLLSFYTTAEVYYT